MNIEQIKERLDSAIIMMDGGGGFDVGDIYLGHQLINGKRILHVSSDTKWSLSALTKQLALQELNEIKDLFHHFQEISKEFMNFSEPCEVRYYLTYLSRMDDQEICMEMDGDIVWSDFYLNARGKK